MFSRNRRWNFRTSRRSVSARVGSHLFDQAGREAGQGNERVVAENCERLLTAEFKSRRVALVSIESPMLVV